MVDGRTRAALDEKMRAMEEAHSEYHGARREAKRVAAGAAVGGALAILAAAVGRGALIWCAAGLLLALAWPVRSALSRRASARNRLAALMDEAAGLCEGR